ncbi:MAG: sugar isomerase domain-containing protein [Verrucomicrobiota bacterium]
MTFEFPSRLRQIEENLTAQADTLQRVACIYADSLMAGGVVHVYANGHSRISVEEMVIRMGALTGFHPLLSNGLVTFTDVVGPNGIRVNQAVEKVEGLAGKIFDEIDVAPNEPLLVVTATGTTPAAVDAALEFNRRFPTHPVIALACAEQSKKAAPKHSSGKNLWHVIESAQHGVFINNGMPYGDLSVKIQGGTGEYDLCPLSSIGALAVVQALNELTVRELDRRGKTHPVLRNMHIAQTEDNYDAWLRDQRRRYAKALCRE